MEQVVMHIDEATSMLGLLAHPGRFRVLGLIMIQEWDVGSLATEVGLSQSALSQHLKKMRDANLVSVRRDAQTIYYSCNCPHMTKLWATVSDIFAQPRSAARAIAGS